MSWSYRGFDHSEAAQHVLRAFDAGLDTARIAEILSANEHEVAQVLAEERTPTEKEIDAQGWLITWTRLLQADPPRHRGEGRMMRFAIPDRSLPLKGLLPFRFVSLPSLGATVWVGFVLTLTIGRVTSLGRQTRRGDVFFRRLRSRRTGLLRVVGHEPVPLSISGDHVQRFLNVQRHDTEPKSVNNFAKHDRSPQTGVGRGALDCLTYRSGRRVFRLLLAQAVRGRAA